jgi:hypothetical protein
MPPAIEPADHSDRECLHGDRHRHHRHCDLRCKRQNQRSGENERSLSNKRTLAETKRIESDFIMMLQ